jgi:hypothetical protein
LAFAAHLSALDRVRLRIDVVQTGKHPHRAPWTSVLVSMHRLALVAGPALPRTPPSTITCFFGCRRGAGLGVTLGTYPVVDGSLGAWSVLNVRDRQVRLTQQLEALDVHPWRPGTL